MSNGKVYFPASISWLADFEAELLQFPAGKNDDQVDALSLIGRMLADMSKGELPKPPRPVQGMEALTFDELIKRERQYRRRHG